MYRVEAASVRAIVSLDDDEAMANVEQAAQLISEPLRMISLNGSRPGWDSLHEKMASFAQSFDRPSGDKGTTARDPMLIYFTSGTTGMPKMVLHNFTYPLGHIVTAKFWQNLHEKSLHLTVADTGWAKMLLG